MAVGLEFLGVLRKKSRESRWQEELETSGFLSIGRFAGTSSFAECAWGRSLSEQ